MNQKNLLIGFKASYIGFAILAALALLLYFVSLLSAVEFCITSVIILALSLSGILFTLYTEISTIIKSDKEDKLISRRNLLIFLFVFGGAILTYALSIYAGFGAVIASGLIGVAAAIFIPKYGAPAFCGSFAGMSSALLLSPWAMLFAAVLAGLLYVLARNTLNGFGGKFGTIAFSACMVVALLTGSSVPAKSFTGWEFGFVLIALSVCAAVVTYILSIRFKLGPVLASGLVGVMAGLWLPLIFPGNGSTMAVMIFCASFAGMSAPKRIKNELFVAIAGIIAGLAFIFSFKLQGAGGKLGTIAFGSVMAVYGILKIIRKFIDSQKTKPAKV